MALVRHPVANCVNGRWKGGEEAAEYVITLNGEPVALLRPLTAEDRGRSDSIRRYR